MEETEVLTPFQEWFKSQTKYKTQKELAKATGLNIKYISFYLRGAKQPTEEHRKILYEFTGLECFRAEVKVPEKKEEKKEVEKEEISYNTDLPLHIQLQNWFKSQTKWKTYAEIGKATKIDPSDVGKFFRGDKRPGEKTLQKLSTIIDIEALKQEAKTKIEEKKDIAIKTRKKTEVKKELEEIKVPLDMQKKVIELQKIVSDLSEKVNSFDGMCEKCIANKFPHSKEESGVKERVEIVKELLYALNRELEFFKTGSPESREVFRSLIYAPDVGYIMALLRAIFDEDKFQTWLLMSGYEIKRR